ncbi:MAG: hypothetical protein HYV29_01575 [Ignavibacteriales bacterium]|nr:hypothetical protein [Ignavibacteriales bacterium]
MSRQFTPGQRVRTIFGDITTVRMQIGCRVWLEGYMNEWFHPTKIFSIEK